MGINSFILSLYSINSRKKIQEKIYKLGSGYIYDARFFILIRLYTSIIVAIFFLILSKSFVFSVISFVITHCALNASLDLGISLRKKQIEKDAIFFFNILSLTVTSGKTLKNSIELVTSKMESNLLAREFIYALNNSKNGMSFQETLGSMKKYIPSEDVNSVITSIKQSYELGTPLLESIKKVISVLEEKRFYESKSIINKIPVQISIVSACTIIPIMLLLILGPIIISIM